jgi:hypothetical protein
MIPLPHLFNVSKAARMFQVILHEDLVFTEHFVEILRWHDFTLYQATVGGILQAFVGVLVVAS